jgi:hypothetical protein
MGDYDDMDDMIWHYRNNSVWNASKDGGRSLYLLLIYSHYFIKKYILIIL